VPKFTPEFEGEPKGTLLAQASDGDGFETNGDPCSRSRSGNGRSAGTKTSKCSEEFRSSKTGMALSLQANWSVLIDLTRVERLGVGWGGGRGGDVSGCSRIGGPFRPSFVDGIA